MNEMMSRIFVVKKSLMILVMSRLVATANDYMADIFAGEILLMTSDFIDLSISGDRPLAHAWYRGSLIKIEMSDIDDGLIEEIR